ncbi:MlaD family protein [Piscinibacter sakaiensis]|uniref:MlaD family protein n=1 Tax=Piscinibacter sakaiensis TaxID=1547922 RepID=UPI003AAC8CD3
MEAEARYTWVGAAVLALLAAMVAAVVWLKNIGGDGEFNRYAIHFQQQALDGLEIGAAVTLRGIKVGRVEDYALAGETLDRVRVTIRVDRRAPAYANTVALVTRNFVTGIAQITLVNGDPPGELLVKIPPGEQYPLIGEGRSDLQEIAGRVNEVGEMATKALANINELLSNDNRAALMATVNSVRELTAGLNSRLDTLEQTTRLVGSSATQIGGAAASFSVAARQFGSAADKLGESGERIAGVADRSVQRLDTTLDETERMLTEARLAFGKIATATDSLQKQAVASAKRLEDSAANVDDQLGATLSELRLSIDTATRVLDRLREPRAALLGPDKSQLGPGEKMP